MGWGCTTRSDGEGPIKSCGKHRFGTLGSRPYLPICAGACVGVQ
jgi:hypothetical protein